MDYQTFGLKKCQIENRKKKTKLLNRSTLFFRLKSIWMLNIVIIRYLPAQFCANKVLRTIHR